MSVEVSKFGKDHWSTFGYACSRIVDHKGTVMSQHMRGGDKYPTILKGGEKIAGHNDYDCLEDLESIGLIVNNGTGVNPVLSLTNKGWEVWEVLQRHKESGGNFGEFSIPE